MLFISVSQLCAVESEVNIETDPLLKWKKKCNFEWIEHNCFWPTFVVQTAKLEYRSKFTFFPDMDVYLSSFLKNIQ